MLPQASCLTSLTSITSSLKQGQQYPPCWSVRNEITSAKGSLNAGSQAWDEEEAGRLLLLDTQLKGAPKNSVIQIRYYFNAVFLKTKLNAGEKTIYDKQNT